MKSLRLTKALIWSITQKAIKLKFGEQEKAARDREFALADKLYDACYGKYEKAMQALPKGAFENRTYVEVICSRPHGGIVPTLSLSLALRKPKPRFPSYPVTSEVWDKEFAEIHKETSAMRRQTAELNREVTRYKTQVKAILTQMKTTKQLVELMPEAEEWLVESSCSDIPLADAVAGLRKL